MIDHNDKGHMLNRSILREYDIRGVVDESLTEQDAYAIGRGMATCVKTKLNTNISRFVVAYDGRFSSPSLSRRISKGLSDSGCDVLEIGCGPTPLLYFVTDYTKSDAGIMVTGSHNPPNYNGFKFVVDSKPFYGPSIQELGQVVEKGDFVSGQGNISKASFLNEYIDSLINLSGPLPAQKVVWDPGNGATAEVIRSLIKNLPGEHIIINGTIDGSFPSHHPDPTVPENLLQIKKILIDKGCDLGFAFDGDGDRIGVIDSMGRIIWGDQLIALFARQVLADAPGSKVIADIKSSQVVFDEILRLGGVPIIWKTGHSCIKDKMIEVSAPLAGEMSGHIFFGDRWFGFDDAIYASLRVLAMLKNSNTSLAKLYDSLPQLVNTPEIRFECPDDRKFEIVSEIAQRLKKDGADILSIDGVRVRRGNGWWLLRASNTQPVLVARCEAKDNKTLEELKSELLYHLSKSEIDLPKLS